MKAECILPWNKKNSISFVLFGFTCDYHIDYYNRIDYNYIDHWTYSIIWENITPIYFEQNYESNKIGDKMIRSSIKPYVIFNKMINQILLLVIFPSSLCSVIKSLLNWKCWQTNSEWKMGFFFLFKKPTCDFHLDMGK